MKRLFPIFAAGILFAAAGFAQPGNARYEQYYKARFGRYSPGEKALQKTEQAKTGCPERTAGEDTLRPERIAGTNAWIERWYKAKYGRYSPREEARQRANSRSRMTPSPR